MNQKSPALKMIVLLGLTVASLTACNRGAGDSAGTEQGGTSTVPPPIQIAPEMTPSMPPPADKETKPDAATTPPSGGSSGSGSGNSSGSSSGSTYVAPSGLGEDGSPGGTGAAADSPSDTSSGSMSGNSTGGSR